MTTLHLTPIQHEALKRACELYARVHMGQLDMVAWEKQDRLTDEEYQRLREVLDEAAGIVTGMTKGASYGIRSPHIDERARVAWDMYMALSGDDNKLPVSDEKVRVEDE